MRLFALPVYCGASLFWFSSSFAHLPSLRWSECVELFRLVAADAALVMRLDDGFRIAELLSGPPVAACLAEVMRDGGVPHYINRPFNYFCRNLHRPELFVPAQGEKGLALIFFQPGQQRVANRHD